MKRVAGLPGERIAMKSGRLIVDGRFFEQDSVRGTGTTPDFPETLVSSNCIFVLGDDRANSLDSRSIGEVPLSAILGPADRIVWPPSRAGRIPGHMVAGHL